MRGDDIKMNCFEVLQMRSVVSIFLLLGLGSSAAFAGSLAPCPPLEINYRCEGGIPALSVTRSARGEALDFKLGATQAGGAFGDALISLPSGSETLDLPLGSLPKTVQQIAIVGSDKDGACCLATTSIPAPPAGLCAPPVVSKESDEKAEVSEDALVESPTFDIALALDLEPVCERNAAGHTCSGTLEIGATGTPTGLLPLTLEIEPNHGVDTVLSGPLTCYDSGSGSQFCRAPTDILGSGLTLPILISAGESYEKRTARLCAELSLPKDASSQIRLVQTALDALGYEPGSLDGQNGPSTRAAVQALAARFELEVDDPLDPAFLTLLGLGPFEDDILSNNQACAETVLPPIPRPKVVKKPRKKRASELTEPDIIYDPPEQVCDPATTVLRSETCACRFEGMVRFNATRCVCQNGLPPRAGSICH